MEGVAVLYAAPSTEPITTAEAQTHCRVSSGVDDTYINTLITAARSHIEQVTGRALITQTWDWYLPCWPESDWNIPKAPLVSISSLKYLDNDGTQQTVSASDYQALFAAARIQPGRIIPAYGVSWPSYRDQPNTIVLRFVAGYGNAAALVAAAPQLVHALKLLVEYWYDNRTPVNIGSAVNKLPLGFEDLLAPFCCRD